ncbi:MAG: hypothetical protein VYA34_15680 [Myxococcota bacterium]|nr:hypothetical protein [Myxococcota bacterium]
MMFFLEGLIRKFRNRSEETRPFLQPWIIVDAIGISSILELAQELSKTDFLRERKPKLKTSDETMQAP